MSDLFTATKRWYEVILLSKEFPEADSRWQRVLTPAGWKHSFQERRFLKKKKLQILTVSLALCSHRFPGQNVRESLEYITKALKLDPEFFRDYKGNSTVRETLAFLNEHGASLDQRAASQSADEGYFEVPFPLGVARCSDSQCPCNDTAIPRGEGYVYISKDVVDNRRSARTEAEAALLANRMRQDLERTTGAIVLMDLENVLTPILVCETGARLRGLNMGVAAEDARHWWKTGQVPLRPTPMAGQTAGPPGQQADVALSISTLRTSSNIPELVSAIEQLSRVDDEIVPKVFTVAMLKIPSEGDKTAINALAEAQNRLRGKALQYYQRTKDTPMVALLGQIKQELVDAEGSGRADMKELALLYADVFGG